MRGAETHIFHVEMIHLTLYFPKYQYYLCMCNYWLEYFYGQRHDITACFSEGTNLAMAREVP